VHTQVREECVYGIINEIRIGVKTNKPIKECCEETHVKICAGKNLSDT
jgi:hypothetical protein